MYPELNGGLPATAEAVGWPYDTIGHQTLFSPGWKNPRSDETVIGHNARLSELTYANQEDIADCANKYPLPTPGIASGAIMKRGSFRLRRSTTRSPACVTVEFLQRKSVTAGDRPKFTRERFFHKISISKCSV